MFLLLKAFYGLFFGLSILGFLGATVLACFSVVKVRLIMYFACALLFVFGFVSFVLLIILGALAPNLSQICGYVDVKLQTGAGTADLFARLGFNSLGSLYSNCMGDGTGWLMNDLSPSFNTSFADLLLISQSVQLFSLVIPSYSTANLTAPLTAGNATVSKVSNAQLLDLNDSTATTFLSKVRSIAYPVDASCTALNVNGDAWMASYDLYSCPGGKAQNSPCLDLSNLATCPLGCYEILNEFQAASGDSNYTTSLAIRYGSSTCNYFTYIKNLEQNWNAPRQSSMAGVATSLADLLNKVTDYDNTFKATQANISNYKTILESSYNGVDNLTAGTFNGLDCRVLGESIADMRDSLCVGLLNSLYYNLVCLVLLSYGVLLAACCTVCAGVRHFRHLQKMQIHIGYKGVPVSIADTSKIL
jgi:hypothetical protein